LVLTAEAIEQRSASVREKTNHQKLKPKPKAKKPKKRTKAKSQGKHKDLQTPSQ